ALRPRRGRKVGDVVAVEHDAATARRQHTGDEIDEARLAGPVRPDQRMPRARRQLEVDVIRDHERAKTLAQLLGFEPARAHGDFRLRRMRSMVPSTPPRAKITMKIMNRPIQKYQ